MRSDLRFKASFLLFPICWFKRDRLWRNGAGGDWIISMEDEVRPQYAVICCVGADKETGRSIPHLTLGSEQGAGSRELAVTLCHTLLPFTIRRTSVVTVNPPWHKSFILVSCPLVYLNVLNQANHKSDAHISTISLNKSKYFKLRLTKIVNNTTEHLNLRHSEFVLNRQTHILSYTLSSCPGLKTKCCRCVAKPISSKLINFLKSP